MYLCCRAICNYTNTYACEIITMQWRWRAKTSLKNIPLNLFERVRKGLLKVLLWEGVGDQTELQYIDPPLLWPSVLCLSRSPGLLNLRPRGPLRWIRAFSTASCHQRVSKLTPGSQGPLLLGGGFLYHILSPTGLVSKLNWGSRGSLLQGGGFLYHILSLTHLISN